MSIAQVQAQSSNGTPACLASSVVPGGSEFNIRRRLLQCNWCARVPLATDEILRQQFKLSEHICVLNRADLSEFLNFDSVIIVSSVRHSTEPGQ